MKTACLLSLLIAFSIQAAEVRTERVPEGGVQPQIVNDASGTLHLVYLTGAAGGSNVRYAARKAGASAWGSSATINSTPDTAVAAGTIRGAQLTVGRDSALHVVWNGPGGRDRPSPLYYSRSLDGGRTFAAQRDLRGETKGLDGGATIAANATGDVFILWHGARAEAAPGEVNRVIFVLKSTDNGATFAPVQIANLDDLGVCACCSMKSFITPSGELLTLYRAARQLDQREITLLSSRDGGGTFTHQVLAPWPVKVCPMSSMTMTGVSGHTRAAWETEGKIYTRLLDDTAAAIPVSPAKSRHPALAVNQSGETVVSFSIGTGWQKGGQVGWVLLDKGGQPTSTRGTAPGVPVWGMTAAYADGNDFVVMY